MAASRPEGIIARRDGDQFKRFPNGLKATLKALRKFWHPRSRREYRKGTGKTPEQFAKVFQETINRVGGYYGENKAASAAAIVSATLRLEGSGKQNISDITYWKIRAYAEFVGLPTSLLLLFSQLVSYEAQGHSRAEIAAFLSKCRRSIVVLEESLVATSTERYFHQELSSTEAKKEYIARLCGLYEMADAFGKWEDRLK